MINKLLELIRKFISLTPAIILAIYAHEFAHYYFAKKLDSKSVYWFKPRFLKVFDPLGVIMYYLYYYGWSRPYPINFWRLKAKSRSGLILTILSGPLANLIIGVTSIFLFYIFKLNNYCIYTAENVGDNIFLIFFSEIIYWISIVNLNTAIFNMLPFPTLDGGNLIKVFASEKYLQWSAKFQIYGILLLIVLSLIGIIQLLMIPVNEFVFWLSAFFN